MNLPLEERVSTLEAQMEATQAILHQTALLQQRHSESIAEVNARLDRMDQQQQQNIDAIDRLTAKQDRNEDAIAQLATKQRESIEAIDRLTVKQRENIDAIAEITAKQKHNENMLTEVLRVMGNLGSRSSQNQAGVESLHDAVGRLTRAADADRQEMRNAANELRSMTSRLDALVNYLMRES